MGLAESGADCGRPCRNRADEDIGPYGRGNFVGAGVLTGPFLENNGLSGKKYRIFVFHEADLFFGGGPLTFSIIEVILGVRMLEYRE